MQVRTFLCTVPFVAKPKSCTYRHAVQIGLTDTANPFCKIATQGLDIYFYNCIMQIPCERFHYLARHK